MSYVDYEFYTNKFLGKEISEEEFLKYAKLASKKADTFLVRPPEDDEVCDELKCAVCEICDILYMEESRDGIKYERNDGYWVSFDEGDTVAEKIKKCMKTWLFSNKLLYRGRNI